LKYFSDANRAKNIKNKPRINEDPRDAQMKLLQDEINNFSIQEMYLVEINYHQVAM
jgi:hypothetical protein